MMRSWHRHEPTRGAASPGRPAEWMGRLPVQNAAARRGRGLAPGRQVRCGFCNRLLEVPYLPRAADAPWRRRRFATPEVAPWAWAALAVAVVAILSARRVPVLQAAIRLRPGAIDQPSPRSSAVNEADGRLDQALIDLDAAIEMARKAGPALSRPARRLGRRNDPTSPGARPRTSLDRLRGSRPLSFPLGDWLNLIARASRDPDLAPLVPRSISSSRPHSNAKSTTTSRPRAEPSRRDTSSRPSHLRADRRTARPSRARQAAQRSAPRPRNS